MAVVRATVDSHLRVESELPLGLYNEITAALRFPNRERQNARRERRYGWRDMPTEIELYAHDGPTLVLPRGFLWQFREGLRELGHDLELRDERGGERVLSVAQPISLRPHQGPAAAAILAAQDGIYQAPTGSGKTVTVLEVVRRACMAMNIVVVDKIEIAEQWADRATQYLPSYEVGIIGDGTWDERRLTIATQQTLYSRMDDLDLDGWWGRWGLACLDECHRQTAATFQEVMSRFRGRYRFGVSATPQKTGDFEYAEAVLGDIVHATPLEPLRVQGVLVKPTIRIVETGFYFAFHSTFTAPPGTKKGQCKVSDCEKAGRHMHRNNYQSVVRALKEDVARNELIVRRIFAEQGHRQLVVSPQKGHLEIIAGMLAKKQFGEPVYWLTGKETRKQRRRVVEAVTDHPCVVLSTTAFEALDVPLLDRGHLVWPTANADLVRQVVGRFVRAADGKEDAFVNDYADPLVPVFGKQLSQRLYGCYYPDDCAVLHGC